MSLDDPHVSGAASPSPVQVDIVGEGDDFLSDASDMDDPEDRKPRRTRFAFCSFHPVLRHSVQLTTFWCDVRLSR